MSVNPALPSIFRSGPVRGTESGLGARAREILVGAPFSVAHHLLQSQLRRLCDASPLGPSHRPPVRAPPVWQTLAPCDQASFQCLKLLLRHVLHVILQTSSALCTTDRPCAPSARRQQLEGGGRAVRSPPSSGRMPRRRFLLEGALAHDCGDSRCFPTCQQATGSRAPWSTCRNSRSQRPCPWTSSALCLVMPRLPEHRGHPRGMSSAAPHSGGTSWLARRATPTID